MPLLGNLLFPSICCVWAEEESAAAGSVHAGVGVATNDSES